MLLLVLRCQCIEEAIKHLKDAEHKQPLFNAKLCVCTCVLIGNRTALNKRLRLRQSIALDFCSCFNFLWQRESFVNIKRNTVPLRKKRLQILKAENN